MIKVDSIEQLKFLSRLYSSGITHIQGGGGNISVKDGQTMYIKSSGYNFEDVYKDEAFVGVDFNTIKESLREDDISENSYFESLNTALLPGFTMRPSMETGFHAVLDKYVIHTHPVAVNILTCSDSLNDLIGSIVQDNFSCIQYSSPGLGITQEILKEIGNESKVFFLENHGVIVHSKDFEEVQFLYSSLISHFEAFFKISSYVEIKMSKCQSGYIGSSFQAEEIEIFKTLDSKVLYPDQEVFLNDLSLCNFIDNKIYYPFDLKKSISLEENVRAILAIELGIRNKGLKAKYLSMNERAYIRNMKAEKYRKKV